MEHCDKHFSNMERFSMDSKCNRNLQHDSKHNRMPLQMQLNLPLRKFKMRLKHKNCKLHRIAYRRSLEHRFKHHADLGRFSMESFNNRSLQFNSKYDSVQIQMCDKLHMG